MTPKKPPPQIKKRPRKKITQDRLKKVIGECADTLDSNADMLGRLTLGNVAHNSASVRWLTDETAKRLRKLIEDMTTKKSSPVQPAPTRERRRG